MSQLILSTSGNRRYETGITDGYNDDFIKYSGITIVDKIIICYNDDGSYLIRIWENVPDDTQQYYTEDNVYLTKDCYNNSISPATFTEFPLSNVDKSCIDFEFIRPHLMKIYKCYDLGNIIKGINVRCRDFITNKRLHKHTKYDTIDKIVSSSKTQLINHFRTFEKDVSRKYLKDYQIVYNIIINTILHNEIHSNLNDREQKTNPHISKKKKRQA